MLQDGHEAEMEAQEAMLDTGHLRLPVFEENLDTIHGVLIGRAVWRAARIASPLLASKLFERFLRRPGLGEPTANEQERPSGDGA